MNEELNEATAIQNKGESMGGDLPKSLQDKRVKKYYEHLFVEDSPNTLKIATMSFEVGFSACYTEMQDRLEESNNVKDQLMVSILLADEREQVLVEALEGLLNKVNRVASRHRHGEQVLETDMIALGIRQLETEQALKGNK